jgi:hypothetical protein
VKGSSGGWWLVVVVVVGVCVCVCGGEPRSLWPLPDSLCPCPWQFAPSADLARGTRRSGHSSRTADIGDDE